MARKLPANMRWRNGRIQASVFLHKGPGGRPTAMFDTVREARDWQTQTRLNHQHRTHDIPTHITVAEYVDVYLARREFRSDSTRRTVTASLRTHVTNSPLARMRLVDVRADHIDDWVRELQTRPGRDGKPMMASTVRRHFTTLNTMLKHAARNRVITHNPAQDCDVLPVVRRRDYTIITADEFWQQLVPNMPARYQTLTVFLCYAGVRWDEARRLNVSDLRPLSNEVRIVSTKTGVRERWHVLAPWLMQRLVKHIAEYGLRPDQALFSTRTGGRIINSEYNRQLKRACRKSGLPDSLRPHDLRHCCASWLFDEGFSTMEVGKYLGHANDGVTRQVYIHVLEDRLRVVAESLPRPPQEVTG